MRNFSLIKKIKGGCKWVGIIQREDYEAFLYGITGKTSLTQMSDYQRYQVVNELTKRGAFKNKRLTGQQKACLKKWQKLQYLGAIKDKSTSALNRFLKPRFGTTRLADLDAGQTNQLLGQLENWIRKVEYGPRKPHEPLIAGQSSSVYPKSAPGGTTINAHLKVVK
ncbi:MAG: hypothetical protein CR977_00135 [Gammaproteobacteria bacterium]|nr:MAG: hypothetical protein CR977_00135 [Gammaproteobacteria bacterium]